MQEDNVYPGTSSPRNFYAPKPKTKEEQDEISEVLSQLPLLKKVVKRLDNRIEASDSVKQALILAKKYNLSRENALVVLDIVRQQLEVERGHIMAQLTKVR